MRIWIDVATQDSARKHGAAIGTLTQIRRCGGCDACELRPPAAVVGHACDVVADEATVGVCDDEWIAARDRTTVADVVAARIECGPARIRQQHRATLFAPPCHENAR